MSQKIKLLFLSAAPAGGDPTDSDIEYRDVEARIRSGLYAESFDIAIAPALKRSDLQSALLRHQPQIVHFSGHSDREGIFLEGDERGVAKVTGPALAELFAILRGTVRTVVLNSCESVAIARAFQHFVDYTVAMNRRISNEAAITFATSFYNALATRQSVPTAFALAVNQLRMENHPEFDAPQLFVGAMFHSNAEADRDAQSARDASASRKVESNSGAWIQGSIVRGSVVVVNGDGNVVVTR